MLLTGGRRPPVMALAIMAGRAVTVCCARQRGLPRSSVATCCQRVASLTSLQPRRGPASVQRSHLPTSNPPPLPTPLVERWLCGDADLGATGRVGRAAGGHRYLLQGRVWPARLARTRRRPSGDRYDVDTVMPHEHGVLRGDDAER